MKKGLWYHCGVFERDSEMAEMIEYITKLTVAERVQAMEILWGLMSDADENYESPDWHADVLDDRKRRIASGEASFMSIEESKRCLSERACAC